MTLWTLILRSLRHHWRGHLGVLLGAAVGSAALIGALVVGDSVRLSLRDLALQRLGWVDAAMAPADRFFDQSFAQNIWPGSAPKYHRATAALRLPATLARQDGTARANGIQAIGVGPDFWNDSAPEDLKTIPPRSVVLNEALAAQLRAKPGDELVLRLHKPSALSREVPITPQNDASIALRVKVHAIAPADAPGNFSLHASQTPPLNAFLSIKELATAAGIPGKANLLLGSLRGVETLPPRQLYLDFMPGEAASPWDAMLLEYFDRVPTPLRPLLEEAGRSSMTGELLNNLLARSNTLSNLGLELRPLDGGKEIELRSSRIFLDPHVTLSVLEPTAHPLDRSQLLSQMVPVYPKEATSKSLSPFPYRQNIATNARPILTYLVNQLRSGERSVPYSMVSAAGSPLTPTDIKDDEVVINQWLADDMQLKVGETLDLTYFLVESGASLLERTNRFRIHSVVPMEGIHSDRQLMPEFPGLAKAESTHDWDAGFPLVHKIRNQDEAYWKKYRGTPKAFITLAAGQRMWANRFGNLTAIRFPVPESQSVSNVTDAIEGSFLSDIQPSKLGLHFDSVRAEALAGASQSQDFGGLFIGFSFFLILAALILMALLFQFGLEQRTAELGTLLALGFTPRRVRWLLLGEGTAVAFVGGVLGAFGGVGYAQAMLHGLTTLWRDAVGTSALRFHVTPMTLGIGLVASVLVCAATIWFVLRKQAARSARELMADAAGEVQSSKLKAQKSKWIVLGCGGAALGLIGWAVGQGDAASAQIFFGAGALLLVAELAAVAVLLTALDRSEWSRGLSLGALGVRGCTRRRTRSLASVALLASGSFLVVAVGANKLDAVRDAAKRSSGTGGFALFGEATLPVVRDLNTASGREFFGLDEKAMAGVSVVPFRVRDGDEASCLNLNRAQTPRLLGVKPELLAERKAFTFAQVLKGADATKGWTLLMRERDDAIPAIGDAASIQWALGKKIGDTIEYTDERGAKFQLRLVAGVANSILQGSLIIDEAEFVKRFPSEAGHRMFLIDTPSNTGADVEKTSATLSRALQDVGLELTPTTRRLAAFNAVQNTYLNTFQILGGLGLLLGSAGLGAVVLRNVLERRGELGLLQAVGFRRRSLRWLVLSEHGGLLGLGLACGILAALTAVLPALLAPGAETHLTALALTLGGVFVSGLLWTWAATSFALRGRLLDALRNE